MLDGSMKKIKGLVGSEEEKGARRWVQAYVLTFLRILNGALMV